MFRTMRLQALLCLLLILQLATAQDFRALRRDDDSISSPVPLPSSEPSSQPSVTKDPGDDGKKTTTEAPREPATTRAPDSTTSTKPAIQTTTTVASESPLNNSTLFNSTIPEGNLPIQPVITPGWGVAGIILMLTGFVYTLVGINNRWINCFFSTAYLTALGITVLIVYIMNLPVSDAIQGAYVVAVTLSGCALGAASLIFKELTEGLGCALGGFCLSMWFLCLAPGGLLHDTLGRAIFISCFSVVGFGFYFSRYTRDWAMIILMSFGGSTVIVLGIDCYSRAGLKEFWAYVWNLNNNLFPLGANTYPITRGIRVEIAAVIIICLVGIISQIKLWKIVREKREKKAQSLAEDQRCMEQEEENVGRNIEEQTARERVEWEKVYGGRTLNNCNGTVSHYSEGTDGSSNSKGPPGGCSESVYTDSKIDGIEMADLSDSSVAPARVDGLISSEMAQEGKVMVRVAADEIVVETPNGSEGEVANEKIDAVSEPDAVSAGNDKSGPQTDVAKEKQISQASSAPRRSSRQRNITPAPEIVPLPFKVPTEQDSISVGDRSSVATFADDEAIVPAINPRDSLVKRVSQNSVTLLRSLSQQGLKNVTSDRRLESGESSEELVEPEATAHDDDGSSLAATVDYESMSDDYEHDSIVSTDNRKSIEITAELGRVEKDQELKQTESDTTAESDVDKLKDDKSQEAAKQSTQTGPNEEHDDINLEPSEKHDDHELDKGGSEVKAGNAIEDKETLVPHEQEPAATASSVAGGKLPESTEKTKSASSATSNLINLTKDRLPKSLSKVALSYRTNEWAKHLGHADTPEPDTIHIEPYVSGKEVKEVPRHVDVEDLQKTIADDTLPPAANRPNAKSTQASFTQPNLKIGKKQVHLSNVIVSTSVLPDAANPGGSPGSPPIDATPLQPASVTLRRTSSGFAPIVEEQNSMLATMAIPQEIPQQDGIQLDPAPFRPIISRGVSFSNPQTLLGQRESVLRSRSQGNLVAHISGIPVDTQGYVGDSDSLHNYPVHNRALSPDLDDVPLSRRREMIRQSSMTNLPPSNYRLNRSSSGVEVSGNTQFNSHQPKRISSISITAQEAKLANFRQSIAQDLQLMTPGVPNSGRENPFSSTSTLIDDMDIQRTAMIEKREAEMQRREMQRREKERQDRMFDTRMRSGDLLGAHREVLRKMQSSAKDA
ncbi:hypothetical protein V8C37DRAFT_192693 [Trichoderma ceciliae]